MYALQPTTHIESLEDFPEMRHVLGSTMAETSGVGELSGHATTYGNTEFLLCKFFLALIQNEEKLSKAKREFLELRFDYE